jgi:hypothetical protein
MNFDDDQKKFQTKLEDLDKQIGTDRWLMDNGLVSSSTQENLLAYGYLSSEYVSNVEVLVNVENKTVVYKVQLPRKAAKQYKRFRKFFDSQPASLVGKYRKLRNIRNSHRINVEGNLCRFLKDYLPGYKVETEILVGGKMPPRNSMVTYFMVKLFKKLWKRL